MRLKKKPIYSIKDVKILDNKVCHSGFLQVNRVRLSHRLYDGSWSQEYDREVLSRAPGVGVLLFDAVTDQLLLAEQFRIGCLHDERKGPWALELIAGVVDSDESEEMVARRECQEEAGVQIGALLPVARYYNSPGGSAEQITIYCASFDATAFAAEFGTMATFGLEQENEDICTMLADRTALMSALEQGILNNAMIIIALQWLDRNLETVKSAFARQ